MKRAEPEDVGIRALIPREIVAELDRHIVGQAEAKRAVAIALRNRWRRLQVPEELRDEIVPKNIIMVGPTGVGKTEIARRLAKLAQAPFVKVEASKFTEVGYVGRDVESMIRDLVEIAVRMVRAEEMEKVADQAKAAAEERLLDLLLPHTPVKEGEATAGADVAGVAAPEEGVVEPLGDVAVDFLLDEHAPSANAATKPIVSGTTSCRLMCIPLSRVPGMPGLHLTGSILD